MNAAYLKAKYESGLPYDQYVRSGKPQQFDDWQALFERTALTEPQGQLVSGFTRKMQVIAVSGIWCGDCVQQGPLIQRIAAGNPQMINLRWVDRDEHMDLQEQVSINAGHRVPVVIFCAEDYELVDWYGDRTLSRYRAMAQKNLGPSCPLPGAAVPEGEQEATLQDWLDQFERVHLLLRLSSRLRQIHGD